MYQKDMGKRFVVRALATALGITGVAGTSGTAAAAKPVTLDFTCPYDGTKFSAAQVVMARSSDTTLDLKPVGEIPSPWPLAICPTNGFVFFKLQFSEDELAKLKPFVFSDEFKAMQNESPYYRAAWLNEHLGAKHSDVTWFLDIKLIRYAHDFVDGDGHPVKIDKDGKKAEVKDVGDVEF